MNIKELIKRLDLQYIENELDRIADEIFWLERTKEKLLEKKKLLED